MGTELIAVMDKLLAYLQYDFVKYAFIVGILIALCSALLGSVIVTKRMSFIGDGLSHVAFGAATIASVLGFTDNIYIVLPITILFSIFLLRDAKSVKTPNDAVLAVVSVCGLAFGYLFLNVFSNSGNLSGDVCGFLFGATSILTLTVDKVITCCVLSVLVILFFILFYNKIYAVTFDEVFAKVSGTKLRMYKIIIAVLIDTIIVLAMNLVGSLLISALIILPTLAAMRVCSSFKGMIIVSSVLSVVGATVGLIISILCGTPVGCTIVMVDLVAFCCFYAFERMMKK